MEDGLLMRTSASNSSLRARTKLEALDNLVISTIHGLSTKIRTNAETLLRKLRYLSNEEILSETAGSGTNGFTLCRLIHLNLNLFPLLIYIM